MDNHQLARMLHEIYAPLIDSEMRADGVHDEPAELPMPDMRRALRRRYDADPSVKGLLLRVAGVEVGVTSRERVCQDTGVAGPAETPFGEGDRATQPGDSTQYRVIVFRCRSCAGTATTVFFDERRIPSCDTHGRMELHL